MLDFTYNTEEISNNPVWQLAFSISETLNDEAPIGWSKYIGVATVLLSNYDIKRKKLPVLTEVLNLLALKLSEKLT